LGTFNIIAYRVPKKMIEMLKRQLLRMLETFSCF
jgi:hypothetical protein